MQKHPSGCKADRCYFYFLYLFIGIKLPEALTTLITAKANYLFASSDRKGISKSDFPKEIPKRICLKWHLYDMVFLPVIYQQHIMLPGPNQACLGQGISYLKSQCRRNYCLYNIKGKKGYHSCGYRLGRIKLGTH